MDRSKISNKLTYFNFKPTQLQLQNLAQVLPRPAYHIHLFLMKFMSIVQQEFIKLECQEKEYLKSGANVWSKFLEKKRGKKKTYTRFLYWLKVVVTQLLLFFN